MPRPLKYDWDDKRDICYKLNVEQKLPPSQIIKHFAKTFNIPESELPGRSQLRVKFKEWGFPPRLEKLSKEDEEVIAERCRELFNQNYTAASIKKVLNDEGWTLDEYLFRKIRRKHGMLMRFDNAFRKPQPKKRPASSNADGGEDGQDSSQVVDDEALPEDTQPAPLSPAEAARRAQRMAELEVQSQHLLQTRKRRRRIRGYGHLPPDGPDIAPRYGSETSLDECKAFLHLTNELYVQIRDQYEAICRDMGIIKMSLCAGGQWQASKDRLVRESMHLSSVLHPLQPDIDRRLNALNCICSDVTKRMRNQGKAISIADANNLLGLNPIESKDVRKKFYEILEADQFTTVLACGREHLDELRQQWYPQFDVLQKAVASGDTQKLRAVDLLEKDARKRYCDDQTRKDPSKKQWQKQKHYGPGPGPAQELRKSHKKGEARAKDPSRASYGPSNSRNISRRLIPVGPAWEGREAPEFRMSTITDIVPPINFDLDPLLTATTHGPPWPPTAPQSSQAAQPAPAPPLTGPASSAILAYFRLSLSSQLVGHHPRMWLGKLATPTVDSLHKAATSKASAAQVTKTHGIVKNNDGTEDSWLIENDDELNVYIEEAGEKATFVVVLEG